MALRDRATPADPAVARAALRAGAVGDVLEESDGDALLAAVERTMAGGRYVDPSLTVLRHDRDPYSAA